MAMGHLENELGQASSPRKLSRFYRIRLATVRQSWRRPFPYGKEFVPFIVVNGIQWPIVSEGQTCCRFVITTLFLHDQEGSDLLGKNIHDMLQEEMNFVTKRREINYLDRKYQLSHLRKYNLLLVVIHLLVAFEAVRVY